MSRKSKEAKRALAQAEADAKALSTSKQSFNTLEGANAALAQAAEVINMKDRKKAKEEKEAKATTTKATRTGGMTGNLKRLPPLPKSATARKERPVKPCECGCGETTKSRFAPGHDSYLRGLVLRVERDIMKMEDVDPRHHEAVRRELKERKAKAKAQTAAAAGE